MLLRPLFFTSYLIDDFLRGGRLLRRRHAGALERVEQDRERARLPALAARRARRRRAHLRPQRRLRARPRRVRPRGPLRRARLAARGPSGVRGHGRRRGGAQRRARALRRRCSPTRRSSAPPTTTSMGAVPDSLPGPRPTFFFAPDRVAKRTPDWGREGLEARLAEAWRPYLEWTAQLAEGDPRRGAARPCRTPTSTCSTGASTPPGRTCSPCRALASRRRRRRRRPGVTPAATFSTSLPVFSPAEQPQQRVGEVLEALGDVLARDLSLPAASQSASSVAPSR